MVFKLFSLIFMAGALFQDFKKDQGKFRKAKIFHACCLTYLIYFYSGSFAYLGWLIGHLEKFKQRFHVPAGIISAELNFYSTVFHVIICLFILIFTYGMITRKEKSRKNFLNVILLVIPTDVISFYRSFQSEDPIEYDYLVLLLGLLFSAGICFGIYFIYRSHMMKDFFAGKNNQELLPEAEPETIA